MNYKNILITKIQKLLSNEMSVPEFQKDYYMYSLEQVPGDALEGLDSAFFSLVREGLDWTVENPAEIEKKDGYMNYGEYKKWLKRHYDGFINSPEAWYKEYNSSSRLFKQH